MRHQRGLIERLVQQAHANVPFYRNPSRRSGASRRHGRSIALERGTDAHPPGGDHP
jgi:hypothetical protein